MAHFLNRVSYPELSNALLESDRRLAAQIAGIAFEQRVRQQAARDLRDGWDDKDLIEVIDEFHRRGLIDRRTWSDWDEARRVRNTTIHKNVTPTDLQVKVLLKALNVLKY
jgi:hypothetical protein